MKKGQIFQITFKGAEISNGVLRQFYFRSVTSPCPLNALGKFKKWTEKVDNDLVLEYEAN